ncbi:hypothetical protein [Riemerella anatipestifer]|uniref:Uncharacterized protein n=1 Tax=Riemerella anatipestifer TaxID=34085 RepID=A0A1S7DQS2_RIEAN|nr:hypothetical protein [Riemerella anatipestifer]AQY21381.1 hypothetical protein AB406_0423 [Riemerella anatipestifer]
MAALIIISVIIFLLVIIVSSIGNIEQSKSTNIKKNKSEKDYIFNTTINDKPISIDLRDIDDKRVEEEITRLDRETKALKENLFRNESISKQCRSLMDKAKSLENTDINTSIQLYQQVIKLQEKSTSNFYPEKRLLILYRKIKDIENEKKILIKIIDDIKKTNEKRLHNALLSDKKKEKEITEAWRNFEWYVGSDGRRRKCSKDYSKYTERLEKLEL